MMKLFLLTLILASRAIACPDLAGRYAVCKSVTGLSSGSYDLVVEQSDDSFILTQTNADTGYRNSSKYKANGKLDVDIKIDPITGIVLKVDTTSTCADSELLVKSVIFLNGQEFIRMQTVLSRSGDTLSMAMTGQNSDQPVSDTLICR